MTGGWVPVAEWGTLGWEKTLEEFWLWTKVYKRDGRQKHAKGHPGISLTDNWPQILSTASGEMTGKLLNGAVGRLAMEERDTEWRLPVHASGKPSRRTNQR